MTQTLQDWCEAELSTAAFDWLFDPKDIWGRLTAAPLNAALLSAPPHGKPDRQALAWMLRELESRVATRALSGRAGIEERALTSVYELFPGTRAFLTDRAPEAIWASDILWWMLNRDVRPFTAHWHRYSASGHLQDGDQAERFRRELVVLQKGLRVWAAFLRTALGHASPQGLPSLPEKTPLGLPFARYVEPRSLPKQDGLAVPILRAHAFSTLMTKEKGEIDAWRKETRRDEAGPPTGIALSGGGIRSATLALGVLRALARSVDIFGVDYLSTVSGGGYTGTLLTAAFAHDLFDPKHPGRGPLSHGQGAQDDIGASVMGWLRSQSKNMKVDRAGLAAVLTDVVRANGASAREYRKRLTQTWLVARSEASEGAGMVVVKSAEDDRITRVSPRATGPLHLWCMALNATNLDPKLRRALRGREADVYTVSRVGAECRLLGFAEADDEFQWTWGQAMALSGAALAPSLGDEYSQTWLAAAAAAGLNLGGWINHDTGDERKPTFWDRVRPLFGRSDATLDRAFVTDGGHIENSGLYQLLRRRCALMLAVDGGGDPEGGLDTLGTLQHLARVELRTHLIIDPIDVEVDASGRSNRHFFVIRVVYPDDQHGVIVYVKPSITGDEPWYLKRYRVRNPSFPNDAIVHQAFDDRKFEAYLALGEHMGESMLRVVERATERDPSVRKKENEEAPPAREGVSFEGFVQGLVEEMDDR